MPLIQILPASVAVVQHPKTFICWCLLLLAENDLDVRSCDTLQVVLKLPRNSRLSTTPYCLVSEGSMFTRPNAWIVRFDSISTFNVQRSLSVGLYDHTRGFQYHNTNSHVRNITFLTQIQRLWAKTRLLNEIITCYAPFCKFLKLVYKVSLSDARILSSANI